MDLVMDLRKIDEDTIGSIWREGRMREKEEKERYGGEWGRKG